MTLAPEEIEKRYRLLPCISLSWIKRLKALGVTVDALCEPDFPASGHVVFFDGSRFEFVADAHGGQAFEAMLLLALDEFGEVCDIVAYDPRRKLKAFWLGNAPLLGLEQVWLPRLDPQGALTVFADPVEWLLGDRLGVVVVHPARAASILRNVEPLQVSSAPFGRRLGALINPRLPRIYAPAEEILPLT
jgi:hypothetical protein